MGSVSSVGLQEVVGAYLTWQTPIQSARFVTLEQLELKGSLEEDPTYARYDS